MKRNLPILLALIFGFSSLFSQNKDSLWTTTLKGAPVWIDVAMDGTLMVNYGSDQGPSPSAHDLVGLDPATGAIKWNFRVVESPELGIRCEYVPNTPFLEIKGIPLTIIDPSDGHVVFDIRKHGVADIENHGFLLQSGHLWVSGKINGERSIAVFSLSTGAMLWSNSDFLKQKNKMASKLAKFGALTGAGTLSTTVINLLSAPINHGLDAMILATTNGLFQVQLNSGTVDWEAELPDPNKRKMIKTEVGNGEMRLIPGRDDNFYVANAAFFVACSYTDGKQQWSKPVKTSGLVNRISYDEKGLILFPGSSNAKGVLSHNYIKMVNEKTGESIWDGDGIKFNGVVKRSLYTDKGLVVVMENESEKNLVNFIDVAAGKFVLPKSVTLDGKIEYVEVTPKGLFYRTDRTANILDINTDKPLLELPVLGKNKHIVYTNTPDHFYFYFEEDHNVYDINKTEGTGRQLNKAKIEFKGGETPAHVQVRQDGVVLYSDHNATLITPAGDAKYSMYHATPHKLDEIFNIISKGLDDFNAIIEVDDVYGQNKKISDVAIGSSGDPNANRNQYNQLNQAYATAGTAAYIRGLKQFPLIRDRMIARKKPKERIYMMTKVDGRSVILAVNKDDGSTGFQLPLAKGDETPTYTTDEVSGLVFYNPRGTSLIGWPKGSQTGITAYKVQTP